MNTFKKGQQVWWDDPAHEKSGEYNVLAVDYAQNIVKIGNGKETFEMPSGQMEITCPVSEEDRLQLDKLEQHYHMLGKDALELMREIISRFDEGKLSVEGCSVRAATKTIAPAAFTALQWTMRNCMSSWNMKAEVSVWSRPGIYIPKHSLRLSANWSENYKTSHETTPN